MEVAPLAFMRGRTLNDAFVILDEAQNTTVEQMKMFLTRLGFHSKAVMTGDVTQVDLPQGKAVRADACADASSRASRASPSASFTEVDVVRHPLVQEVIRAYERADAEVKAEAAPGEQQQAGPPTSPAPAPETEGT